MGIPAALDLEDGFHQLVDVLARQPRQRHQRHAAQLRQQPLAFLAQHLERFVLVFDQVPLVEGDHQRTAFALDQVGQGKVLLLEGDGGVEHQHDDFGILDRAQAVAHRQLLQLLGHPRTTPDARRVDQVDHPAFPFPRHEDRVAGNAGFRPDQHALFAHHAVDQRRLAGIGSADNGHVEIALWVPAQRRLVAFAFQHVLSDVDIDLGHFVEIADLEGATLGCLAVNGFRDDGVEFRQA